MYVQVKEPRLQARFWHSATAFNLSPGLMEVTLFGGCPEVPEDLDDDDDDDDALVQIANTTILRFGKSTSHVSCTIVI